MGRSRCRAVALEETKVHPDSVPRPHILDMQHGLLRSALSAQCFENFVARKASGLHPIMRQRRGVGFGYRRTASPYVAERW